LTNSPAYDFIIGAMEKIGKVKMIIICKNGLFGRVDQQAFPCFHGSPPRGPFYF
jgi:hypothetical protein